MVRILLVLKSVYRELLHSLHPKAVIPLKLGGVSVKDEVLRPSNIFVATYIFIFAVASLLLAIICYDDPRMNIESILSAVATTLGNAGPGFGSVGPMLSFAEIHPCRKDAALLLHVDRPAGDSDGAGLAGAGVLEENEIANRYPGPIRF